MRSDFSLNNNNSTGKATASFVLLGMVEARSVDVENRKSRRVLIFL